MLKGLPLPLGSAQNVVSSRSKVVPQTFSDKGAGQTGKERFSVKKMLPAFENVLGKMMEGTYGVSQPKLPFGSVGSVKGIGKKVTDYVNRGTRSSNPMMGAPPEPYSIAAQRWPATPFDWSHKTGMGEQLRGSVDKWGPDIVRAVGKAPGSISPVEPEPFRGAPKEYVPPRSGSGQLASLTDQRFQHLKEDRIGVESLMGDLPENLLSIRRGVQLIGEQVDKSVRAALRIRLKKWYEYLKRKDWEMPNTEVSHQNVAPQALPGHRVGINQKVDTIIGRQKYGESVIGSAQNIVRSVPKPKRIVESFTTGGRSTHSLGSATAEQDFGGETGQVQKVEYGEGNPLVKRVKVLSYRVKSIAEMFVKQTAMPKAVKGDDLPQVIQAEKAVGSLGAAMQQAAGQKQTTSRKDADIGPHQQWYATIDQYRQEAGAYFEGREKKGGLGPKLKAFKQDFDDFMGGFDKLSMLSERFESEFTKIYREYKKLVDRLGSGEGLSDNLETELLDFRRVITTVLGGTEREIIQSFNKIKPVLDKVGNSVMQSFVGPLGSNVGAIGGSVKGVINELDRMVVGAASGKFQADAGALSSRKLTRGATPPAQGQSQALVQGSGREEMSSQRGAVERNFAIMESRINQIRGSALSLATAIGSVNYSFAKWSKDSTTYVEYLDNVVRVLTDRVWRLDRAVATLKGTHTSGGIAGDQFGESVRGVSSAISDEIEQLLILQSVFKRMLAAMREAKKIRDARQPVSDPVTGRPVSSTGVAVADPKSAFLGKIKGNLGPSSLWEGDSAEAEAYRREKQEIEGSQNRAKSRPSALRSGGDIEAATANAEEMFMTDRTPKDAKLEAYIGILGKSVKALAVVIEQMDRQEGAVHERGEGIALQARISKGLLGEDFSLTPKQVKDLHVALSQLFAVKEKGITISHVLSDGLYRLVRSLGIGRKAATELTEQFIMGRRAAVNYSESILGASKSIQNFERINAGMGGRLKSGAAGVLGEGVTPERAALAGHSMAAPLRKIQGGAGGIGNRIEGVWSEYQKVSQGVRSGSMNTEEITSGLDKLSKLVPELQGDIEGLWRDFVRFSSILSNTSDGTDVLGVDMNQLKEVIRGMGGMTDSLASGLRQIREEGDKISQVGAVFGKTEGELDEYGNEIVNVTGESKGLTSATEALDAVIGTKQSLGKVFPATGRKIKEFAGGIDDLIGRMKTLVSVSGKMDGRLAGMLPSGAYSAVERFSGVKHFSPMDDIMGRSKQGKVQKKVGFDIADVDMSKILISKTLKKDKPVKIDKVKQADIENELEFFGRDDEAEAAKLFRKGELERGDKGRSEKGSTIVETVKKKREEAEESVGKALDEIKKAGDNLKSEIPIKINKVQDSLLEGLNAAQKQAVSHVSGPAQIISGPGTGKTEVIARRVANLIQNEGVDPDKIFAGTFTNKAAVEMRERISGYVGEERTPKSIGTLHGLSIPMLKGFLKESGADTNFKILGEDEQAGIVGKVIRDLGVKDLQGKDVIRELSRLKGEGYTAERYGMESTTEKEKDFGKVFSQYEGQLKKAGQVDFDDLINKANEGFNRFPDMLKRFQNQFDHVMVDEFQDVNRTQGEFINSLAAKQRNLFAIGDDDQSIYGFRGARGVSDNLMSSYPDKETIKFSQNYRSTQNIIGAAQDLIKRNIGREEKSVWTDKDVGKPIRKFAAVDESEEAEFIGTQIRKLLDEGMAAKDVGILARTNKQLEIIRNTLRAMKIDIGSEGGKDGVNLMTLHKAKGMEFPNVFLPGVEKGILPSKMAKGKSGEEEERRLLYVGITRAMKNLFVSFRKGQESKFLSEISPKFFEQEGDDLVDAKDVESVDKLAREAREASVNLDEFGEDLDDAGDKAVAAIRKMLKQLGVDDSQGFAKFLKGKVDETGDKKLYKNLDYVEQMRGHYDRQESDVQEKRSSLQNLGLRDARAHVERQFNLVREGFEGFSMEKMGNTFLAGDKSDQSVGKLVASFKRVVPLLNAEDPQGSALMSSFQGFMKPMTAGSDVFRSSISDLRGALSDPNYDMSDLTKRLNGVRENGRKLEESIRESLGWIVAVESHVDKMAARGQEIPEGLRQWLKESKVQASPMLSSVQGFNKGVDNMRLNDVVGALSKVDNAFEKVEVQAKETAVAADKLDRSLDKVDDSAGSVAADIGGGGIGGVGGGGDGSGRPPSRWDRIRDRAGKMGRAVRDYTWRYAEGGPGTSDPIGTPRRRGGGGGAGGGGKGRKDKDFDAIGGFGGGADGGDGGADGGGDSLSVWGVKAYASIQIAERIIWTFREILEVTSEFELAMARVGGVTNTLGASFDRLGTFARNMGKQTIFTANETAEAMEVLARQGFETSSIMSAIPEVLSVAAAEGMKLAEAAEVIAANLKTFELRSSESGRVSNALAAASMRSAGTMKDFGVSMRTVGTFANAANISIEETLTMLSKLSDAGLTPRRASVALRELIQQLERPVRGGWAKELDRMGFSLSDIDPKVHGVIDVVGRLHDRMEEFGGDADRLFTVRGSQAFQILAQQSTESLNSFKDAITGTQSASLLAERQMATVHGSYKKMTSAYQELQISLGTGLRPIVSSILGPITTVMRLLSGMPPALQQATASVTMLGGAFLFLMQASVFALYGHRLMKKQYTEFWGLFRGFAGWIKTGFSNPVVLALVGVATAIGLVVSAWKIYQNLSATRARKEKERLHNEITLYAKLLTKLREQNRLSEMRVFTGVEQGKIIEAANAVGIATVEFDKFGRVVYTSKEQLDGMIVSLGQAGLSFGILKKLKDLREQESFELFSFDDMLLMHEVANSIEGLELKFNSLGEAIFETTQKSKEYYATVKKFQDEDQAGLDKITLRDTEKTVRKLTKQVSDKVYESNYDRTVEDRKESFGKSDVPLTSEDLRIWLTQFATSDDYQDNALKAMVADLYSLEQKRTEGLADTLASVAGLPGVGAMTLDLDKVLRSEADELGTMLRNLRKAINTVRELSGKNAVGSRVIDAPKVDPLRSPEEWKRILSGSKENKELLDTVREQGFKLDKLGRIVEVVDGDTLRVRLSDSGDVVSVRVKGVDTPETQGGKDEPFGTEATKFTEQFIKNLEGQEIRIGFTGETSMSRWVADVSGGGKDLSKELLGAGLGSVDHNMLKYGSEVVKELVDLQLEAMTQRVGIWSEGQEASWTARQDYVMKMIHPGLTKDKDDIKVDEKLGVAAEKLESAGKVLVEGAELMASVSKDRTTGTLSLKEQLNLSEMLTPTYMPIRKKQDEQAVEPTTPGMFADIYKQAIAMKDWFVEPMSDKQLTVLKDQIETAKDLTDFLNEEAIHSTFGVLHERLSVLISSLPGLEEAFKRSSGDVKMKYSDIIRDVKNEYWDKIGEFRVKQEELRSNTLMREIGDAINFEGVLPSASQISVAMRRVSNIRSQLGDESGFIDLKLYEKVVEKAADAQKTLREKQDKSLLGVGKEKTSIMEKGLVEVLSRFVTASLDQLPALFAEILEYEADVLDITAGLPGSGADAAEKARRARELFVNKAMEANEKIADAVAAAYREEDFDSPEAASAAFVVTVKKLAGLMNQLIDPAVDRKIDFDPQTIDMFGIKILGIIDTLLKDLGGDLTTIGERMGSVEIGERVDLAVDTLKNMSETFGNIGSGRLKELLDNLVKNFLKLTKTLESKGLGKSIEELGQGLAYQQPDMLMDQSAKAMALLPEIQDIKINKEQDDRLKELSKLLVSIADNMVMGVSRLTEEQVQARYAEIEMMIGKLGAVDSPHVEKDIQALNGMLVKLVGQRVELVKKDFEDKMQPLGNKDDVSPVEYLDIGSELTDKFGEVLSFLSEDELLGEDAVFSREERERLREQIQKSASDVAGRWIQAIVDGAREVEADAGSIVALEAASGDLDELESVIEDIREMDNLPDKQLEYFNRVFGALDVLQKLFDNVGEKLPYDLEDQLEADVAADTDVARKETVDMSGSSIVEGMKDELSRGKSLEEAKVAYRDNLDELDFTEQFNIMLEASEFAVKVGREQASKTVARMERMIEGGSSLEEALAAYKDFFDASDRTIFERSEVVLQAVDTLIGTSRKVSTDMLSDIQSEIGLIEGGMDIFTHDEMASSISKLKALYEDLGSANVIGAEAEGLRDTILDSIRSLLSAMGVLVESRLEVEGKGANYFNDSSSYAKQDTADTERKADRRLASLKSEEKVAKAGLGPKDTQARQLITARFEEERRLIRFQLDNLEDFQRYQANIRTGISKISDNLALMFTTKTNKKGIKKFNEVSAAFMELESTFNLSQYLSRFGMNLDRASSAMDTFEATADKSGRLFDVYTELNGNSFASLDLNMQKFAGGLSGVLAGLAAGLGPGGVLAGGLGGSVGSWLGSALPGENGAQIGAQLGAAIGTSVYDLFRGDAEDEAEDSVDSDGVTGGHLNVRNTTIHINQLTTEMNAVINESLDLDVVLDEAALLIEQKIYDLNV